MILVDNGNILSHGNPMETFHCFSKYCGYETKFDEGEIKSQQTRKENYPYYFFRFQRKQKLLIGGCMIPYHCLNSQIKCTTFVAHNHSSYVKFIFSSACLLLCLFAKIIIFKV